MNDSTIINQQACDWIAKLNGEPSEQDLAQFRDWMAQSPAHKTEVRHLAKLWDELNILTELAVVEEPATAESLSIGQIFKALLHRIQTTMPAWKMPAFASAALLVLAIIIVPLITGDPNSYSTGVGQQQRVTLDDGSTVLLNTNSQISVDYSLDARNIRLIKGQAHFEVMPDKSKPFKVYAGQGLVRAVGTAFSVYLQPEKLEVTVTEGTIQLSALADISPQLPAQNQNQQHQQTAAPTTKPLALIAAGQQVTLDQPSKTIDRIETVDAPAIVQKLAWHQGLIRFSGDPLQDVVAEISRYTDLSIVILDPEIRDLRIGGFFKVGETDKMLQALETSFGVSVTRLNNKIVHLGTTPNTP